MTTSRIEMRDLILHRWEVRNIGGSFWGMGGENNSGGYFYAQDLNNGLIYVHSYEQAITLRVKIRTAFKTLFLNSVYLFVSKEVFTYYNWRHEPFFFSNGVTIN